MNCSECLNKLNEYIDGELDAQVKAHVQAHLDCCPECDKQYNQLLNIKNSISSLPDEDIPQLFAKKVRTAKRKSGLMRKAYIASTAAAVFFAGIFALSSLGLINLPVKQITGDYEQKTGQPTEYCTDEIRTGNEEGSSAPPEATDIALAYRASLDAKIDDALSFEQIKDMLGAKVIAEDTLLVEVNQYNINKLNDLINSGVLSRTTAFQSNISIGSQVTIIFR